MFLIMEFNNHAKEIRIEFMLIYYFKQKKAQTCIEYVLFITNVI